jgi:hypothetical protein
LSIGKKKKKKKKKKALVKTYCFKRPLADEAKGKQVSRERGKVRKPYARAASGWGTPRKEKKE